ncbi:MAG: glycerate kinase [Clostridia bacterium]|nr:glycerate kinase [Clostridia bacterium]
MKKIVIAPDSFKGTLSSLQVCEIVKQSLLEERDDLEIIEVPIADGGEGMTVSFMCAMAGSEKVELKAKSPLGRDIDVYYAIVSGDTAVIEMAMASGITIEKQNDAMRASTYGTGQIIKHALDKGIRKFFLGIGGSATTDGGFGCVADLGGTFLDKDGNTVALCGQGLSDIVTVDLSELDSRIKESEITVLCDVKNPLYGKNGAAYIFGPQKGADKNQVELLDAGLKNLADISAEYLKKDFSQLEGTGAAGGLGFALVAFLGGTLKGGIDHILDMLSFDEKVKDADLVITGEGKMDSQSLMGKLPFGVAKRCAHTRVAAIVGLNTADEKLIDELGISQVVETNPLHLPFEQVKATAREDLFVAAKKIII